MLDVHAPHQAVRSWMDFLVHIIAITIGLLIAIGLEQAVEYVHHRHQREQIEQQMHTVFSANVSSDADDLRRLASMRASTLSGNRIATQIIVTPSMAPYDSAKENGTVGRRQPWPNSRSASRISPTRPIWAHNWYSRNSTH